MNTTISTPSITTIEYSSRRATNRATGFDTKRAAPPWFAADVIAHRRR